MTDKACILYIEDDPEIVGLVKTMLEQRNYQVLAASTGAEGLATMQRQKPDLVLLDLQLPDVHGLDLHQKMKANSNLAGIPVVIITAWMDKALEEYRDEMRQVEAHLRKPFAPTELYQIVARLLKDH
ncbi:MAG: response regulator [Anaerolineae bacterium]